MSRTRVEIPSGVESSAADGRGESVAADGLGDVGVEVAIKPKHRQTTFEHPDGPQTYSLKTITRLINPPDRVFNQASNS